MFRFLGNGGDLMTLPRTILNVPLFTLNLSSSGMDRRSMSLNGVVAVLLHGFGMYPVAD